MKPEKKRELPYTVMAEAAQDIGKRSEQQDYCIYSELYNDEYGSDVIAVVTDGMGGYKNGRESAHIAGQAFVSCYKRIFSGNVNAALIKAMNYANESLVGLPEGGTTLVCAVIHEWRLYWLSVGDSRIYLYRNGLLRKLNIEHNYKHKLLQSAKNGKKTFNRSLMNRKRNALTSYLGMEFITEYDYNDHEFPLMKNDKILLCSDGLYNTLTDHEIEEILSKSDVLFSDEIVKNTLAKERQNQDNVTTVILNIE